MLPRITGLGRHWKRESIFLYQRDHELDRPHVADPLYPSVGVVFYQKIADNARRSSGSNNPVNSPITHKRRYDEIAKYFVGRYCIDYSCQRLGLW
jgi:hypothetical protein